MRRLATIACLAGAARGGRPPRAAAQERPPLAARLVSCTTGADARLADRGVHRARCRRCRAPTRMWMRFDLLQRTPGEAEYAPVRLPDVGRLAALAARARTAFIYTKRVQGLARARRLPRARARSAGTTPTGACSGARSARPRTCRQPDPRPDLTAGALTAAPGLGADTATYLLDVRNAGRGAARRRSTSSSRSPGCRSRRCASPASPPGEDQRRRASPARAARRGRRVRFVLDAGGGRRGVDEADDVVDRPCPSPMRRPRRRLVRPPDRSLH